MSLIRRPSTIALAFALALTGPATAQQPAPAASAAEAWSRATPGTSTVGVAYVTLSAPSGGGDKLVRASSPIAGTVELHTHSNVDGVMKMRRVDDIPVAAGSTVKLEPGGLHIMLFDLKQGLKEGDSFDLTLVFEKAGEVKLKVPVLKAGAPAPGAAPGGAHGGNAGHKH